MSGLKSGLAWVAVGRLTEMVCCLCMVRLTIMNEARRKNMMSMSGMISSRAFFFGSGETIFIISIASQLFSLNGKPLLLGVVNHHLDVRGGAFQLELEPGHARIEIVERD